MCREPCGGAGPSQGAVVLSQPRCVHVPSPRGWGRVGRLSNPSLAAFLSVVQARDASALPLPGMRLPRLLGPELGFSEESGHGSSAMWLSGPSLGSDRALQRRASSHDPQTHPHTGQGHTRAQPLGCTDGTKMSPSPRWGPWCREWVGPEGQPPSPGAAGLGRGWECAARLRALSQNTTCHQAQPDPRGPLVAQPGPNSWGHPTLSPGATPGHSSPTFLIQQSSVRPQSGAGVTYRHVSHRHCATELGSHDA